MKKNYSVIVFFFLFPIIMSCNEKKQIKYDKKKIEGFWRMQDDEFVSMIITADTISYPDQQASLAYKLVNNSIVRFDTGNYSDTFKMEMRGNDTLTLLCFGIQQTYVRNAKE